MFSNNDIQFIRDRVNSGPQIVRDCWQELKSNCNYFMTTTPDCYASHYEDFVIPKLGFAHVIEQGDPSGYGIRALYLAQNRLIPMNTTNCSHWPYVRKAFGLAFVYDYCQDIMDLNTKQNIENGLYETILWLRNWCIQSGVALNSNNHGHFYAPALGIAAISLNGAIINGSTYDATYDINVASNIVLEVFDGLYDDDGAPYESTFYGMQALGGVFSFAEALKKRNNGNSIIYNQEKLKKLSKWYAYEMLPKLITNGALESGQEWNNNLNSGCYWSTPWRFLQTAYEYNDGISIWIFNNTFQNMNVNRFESVLGPHGSRFRHGYTWDSDLILPILKYKSINEVNPETILPKTCHFKNRGLIYYRSGWNDDNDIQFAFESRYAKNPTSNYYHWHHGDRDKNNFIINIYGEKYAIDAGVYQYNSTSHNCIIIDNKGQSVRPYGSNNLNTSSGWNGSGAIKSFLDGEICGYIHGDAESAYDELYKEINHPTSPSYEIINDPNYPDLNGGYLNPVSNADRYVQYVKLHNGIPNYFVICDDIQKDNNNHTFDFYYHAPSNFLVNNNGNVCRLYKSGVPQTYIDLNIINAGSNYSTTSELVTLQPYFEETVIFNNPLYNHLSQTKITASNCVNPYFHIILYPHKSGILEPTSINNIPTTNGSCAKILWPNNTYEDYSAFKHSLDIQVSVNNNKIATNSKLSLVRKNLNTNNIDQYNINEGTNYSFEGKELFNSYDVITSVINSGAKVVVNGDNISKLKIYAPVATTLEVNDQTVTFGRINDYIYYPYAEVNSSLSENQTWSGEILITDDISTNEYNLTINPGTKVYFNNEKTLSINGNFNSVGTIEFPILFSGLATSDYYMGGVFITEGASVDIEYSHFKNGNTGLFLTEFNGKESILNHLVFENNITGMYVAKSIAIIDHSDFIYNSTGLISQKSELSLHNSNLSYNNNEGLYLFENGNYTISDNHFNYNDLRGVYFKYSSDGQFNSNIVSYNGNPTGTALQGGLVFYQSSPTLRDNQITQNYAPGILSLSTSFPIMNSKSRNIISNNHNDGFSDPYDNEAEVLVKDISFPVIDYGHNDIMDLEGGYLIYGDEDPRLNLLHIRNNYWGTTEIKDIESRLYRGGGFIFTPFDETPNVQQYNEEPIELLFTRAVQAEQDSNYNLAELRYDSLITLYSSFVHAKASLDRIFYTKRKSGKNITIIRSYFNNLINHSDEGISHIAKRMSIRCLMANSDYNMAISEYENWSQITAFLCDSLYSVVDIMSNELLITGGRIGKSQSNNSIKIKDNIRTFSEYKNKSDISLNDLFNKSIKSTINSKPNKFDIYQNYPNPFNPTTTIKYQLPKKCKTSITIYNILGQKVTTLIDQNQEAGTYAVIWDGKNSNSVCVSNGIYIYRIIATTKDNVYINSKKMVLIK